VLQGLIVTHPGFVIDLPLALAVIYVIVIIVWYELLRRIVLGRLARRRSFKARRGEFEQWRRQQDKLAKIGREAARQETAEASEADPARSYYYLARKTAKAERDAAVNRANQAVKEAIERIERRHREIEAALDHEETERIEGEPGRETHDE
jgi:biopolymer transport protein ExbB/TolQ